MSSGFPEDIFFVQKCGEGILDKIKYFHKATIACKNHITNSEKLNNGSFFQQSFAAF